MNIGCLCHLTHAEPAVHTAGCHAAFFVPTPRVGLDDLDLDGPVPAEGRLALA